MKCWAKHPAVKQRGTRSLLCLMEGNQHHCEDVKMFKGWCDSSHDLSLSFLTISLVSSILWVVFRLHNPAAF